MSHYPVAAQIRAVLPRFKDLTDGSDQSFTTYITNGCAGRLCRR